MAESKYHRGSQRFSWPVQMQLQPAISALGGEVRILEGEGHFTFEFEDHEKDGVVGFAVKDFEVRVPSFRTYVGAGRYKTPITVPAFTVSGSRFNAARGFLQKSSGRFGLTLSLEITEREAPFLPELQRMELLSGFDILSLTANLFESGRIDPESGRLEATGALYVGDKEWHSPKDPALMIVTASQGGCKVTANLQASIKKYPSGGPILVPNPIVCPGDSVDLYYKTQFATTATLIGTDGTSVNLAPPSGGMVTVTPKKSVTYRVHASDGGCQADSSDVFVQVITSNTIFKVTATQERIQQDDLGNWYCDWYFDYSNNVSNRVQVHQISGDPDPAANHPADLSGGPIITWQGFVNGGSSGSTTVFAMSYVPVTPPLPLAAVWTFFPHPQTAIDITLPRNASAHFLMVLGCS